MDNVNSGQATPESLASWLSEHDISVVRVEGTNLDSCLIGKVLSPTKARAAVKTGVGFADLAFAADLDNNPIFGYAFPSWRGELLDVFHKPDLSTLIEWAPGEASVLGNFYDRWGQPLPVCPRGILQRVCAELEGAGYKAKVAIEIEASVFEESIHEARQKGFRNLTPLGGKAGFAYHMPKDKQWHEFMGAVGKRLTAIGVSWESWNDEAASGQVEINLPISDPVVACDNWTRVRQVMREVAFELGRTVTFMAKWCDEYGQASHLNISLEDADDDNAFFAENGPSETMRGFIGGVMATLAPTAALSLPWITSYRRISDFEGPPTTATWGLANKYAAVRAITGHPKQSRLEFRVPGSDSNTYLVLAVVLASGLHGLREQLEPPAPFEGMGYGLPEGVAERLPDTIFKALTVLEDDTLLREIMGDELIDHWIGVKRWEWMQYHEHGGEPDEPITEWELTRYFELA